MFKIYNGRNSFWQWDIDQRLIVNCNAKQVHFCHGGSESLTVNVNDGLADVPNILLQTAGKINVYAYIIDDTSAAKYTLCNAVFDVRERSKPAEYVYTETEILCYSNLDERIRRLEWGGGGNAGAGGGYVDLSNYYTKAEVDQVIEEIELTPGPPGNDYVLTEEDKQEIANMIPGGGGGTVVQPDWNQNDSAAADYIKNRPGGYRNNQTIAEFSFDGTVYNPPAGGEFYLEPEHTYVVHFDGTEYLCIANNFGYIGDGSLAGMVFSSTEPFCIGAGVCWASAGGSHTVLIQESSVVKIPAAFVEDNPEIITIEKALYKWSEDDARTCYEELEKNKIVKVIDDNQAKYVIQIRFSYDNSSTQYFEIHYLSSDGLFKYSSITQSAEDTIRHDIYERIAEIELTPGPKGDTGAAGAVFTPSVSAEGVLSWTNNGGLENPEPVNIKGPKGDAGVGDGTTDTTDEIPGYWQTHLAEKISDINAINETYGSGGVSFIFISDTHYPNNNENSVSLINHVVKNTSVRKVFTGGDILHCDDYATIQNTNRGREFTGSFVGEIEFHPMRGNHDYYSGKMSEAAFWDVFYRNIDRYCHSEGKMYYYRDDYAHKLRYIVLDDISPEIAVSDDDRAAQLLWMQNKILELTANWHVIIFQHSIWNGANNAISISGNALITAIDEIYNSAACTIIGVFSGHNHADNAQQRPKGYVLISTGADRILNGQGEAGTTTEQLFDVVNVDLNHKKIRMTRVGRGSDRTISYTRTSSAPIVVTGVSLNTNTLNLQPGGMATLSVEIAPTGATNQNVSWSIESGSNYVNITPNGTSCTVAGLASGTAVIKVVTEDGSKSASCTVNVYEETGATDITNLFSFTETGPVKYADGAVNSSDGNWLHSNYVNIQGYNKIRLVMPVSTNTATSVGCAFYYGDSGRTYAGGEQAGTTTDQTVPWGVTTKEIEIPEGAHWIRTSWVSENASFYNPNVQFSCLAE